MSDALLARVRERNRQARAERAREIAGVVRPPPCVEDRFACAFPIGARVFDRVSGEEGIVIGGTAENVIIPVARK